MPYPDVRNFSRYQEIPLTSEILKQVTTTPCDLDLQTPFTCLFLGLISDSLTTKVITEFNSTANEMDFLLARNMNLPKEDREAFRMIVTKREGEESPSEKFKKKSPPTKKPNEKRKEKETQEVQQEPGANKNYHYNH